MSDGVIGTLRDPSLPPKTARYPAEWTRTLMRQAGWRPSNGHCYLTCCRLCGDPALGRSFRYVEGWVWNPAAPTAVRHAWLEDTDGRILDPTPCWRDTPDAAYLGVIALTVSELLVAQDAHQQPPSLSAGPDLWDASTPLGRHMCTGQQYALWRTTGRSLEEQQARADVMRCGLLSCKPTGRKLKMPANLTKPLAVVKTGEGEAEGLIVVCEDGSAYVYNWRDRAWHELSPIPNTPAAAS